MGWPTKGTGRNYNSHTGFGCFLGAYSKRVICSHIFCRRCRICETAKSKCTPVRQHDCIQNWDTNKSSKSMEAACILYIVTSSPSDRGFVTKVIISDDDNVMRAHLRHENNDDPNDKGKLPIWIYEPDFLADPGHRKKAVAKHFYALANQPVSKSRVSKDMAKRLKKNWGYMIIQNRGKTMDEFIKSAKAPLEHMFNDHTFCDPKWCNVLRAREEGKVYSHPDKFYCKDEPEGKKMYKQLSAITNKYGSEHYLRQSMHPFTTQSNEALNQAQACLTPKSKSFHESRSFHYRHAIVVGSYNWGAKKYWAAVFSRLGIPSSIFFTNHLDEVDKRRKRWKEWHRKPEVKRKRAHKQDATEK